MLLPGAAAAAPALLIRCYYSPGCTELQAALGYTLITALEAAMAAASVY